MPSLNLATGVRVLKAKQPSKKNCQRDVHGRGEDNRSKILRGLVSCEGLCVLKLDGETTVDNDELLERRSTSPWKRMDQRLEASYLARAYTS